VCRRCGKKQRINPRTTVLFFSGLFLIGLFAVATLSAQNASLRARLPWVHAEPPVAQPSARAASSGMLTASELWGFYNLDLAKADERFKDKTFDLTGTISDVRRDFRGNLLLKLATGEPFDNVRATVTGREEGLRAMPGRGQVVALRCTGKGAVIGAPLLEGCVQL